MQTSSAGDVDVYVNVGALASRNDWIERDITDSRNVVLSVENVIGEYFIGLYGYIAADVVLEVNVLSTCPNDCSGNGFCADGVCSCTGEYFGPACSYTAMSLLLGQEITVDFQAAGEWKYFRSNYLSHEWGKNGFFFSVQLEPTDSNPGLVHSYIRYGALPTAMEWDYRGVGVTDPKVTSVVSPALGKYYLGVYAAKDSAYSVRFGAIQSDCPSKCSGESHGTCIDGLGHCQCNTGYSGATCSVRDTPLSPEDAVVTGFVGGEEWNMYSVDVPPATTYSIHVVQSEEAHDCDVYIISGSLHPTLSQYDFKDSTYNTVIDLSLPRLPYSESYWVGIHGYSTCEYELSIVDDAACNVVCINGQCAEGVQFCVCDPGYTGDYCQYPLSELENGIAITNSLQEGKWLYYSFPVSGSNLISLHVNERSSVGMINVFVSSAHLGVPTRHKNQFQDQGVSAQHPLTLRANTNMYTVGVTTSPGAIPGKSSSSQSQLSNHVFNTMPTSPIAVKTERKIQSP
eukprot:CAMPEP_0119120490 /NCGR_PEP_ID=MMETSP1310-20130426/1498_1 /TAXON_ID=464262 /ORGANISM="Genus nov. species nov., Strain RCC2339" /LENGTH=512 /DNA_ID=CAMNT_0007109969 /DNA_START=379 /DNA_END=1915 /DNA_ORIENTATION=-